MDTAGNSRGNYNLIHSTPNQAGANILFVFEMKLSISLNLGNVYFEVIDGFTMLLEKLCFVNKKTNVTFCFFPNSATPVISTHCARPSRRWSLSSNKRNWFSSNVHTCLNWFIQYLPLNIHLNLSTLIPEVHILAHIIDYYAVNC